MKPVASGCALALTVVLFYSLCTVAALLWPTAFAGFVGDIFHGMDFSRLMPEQGYMGATFAWLSGKFNGGTR